MFHDNQVGKKWASAGLCNAEVWDAALAEWCSVFPKDRGMDVANSSAHFESPSPTPASHAIHVTESICHYFPLVDHVL